MHYFAMFDILLFRLIFIIKSSGNIFFLSKSKLTSKYAWIFMYLVYSSETVERNGMNLMKIKNLLILEHFATLPYLMAFLSITELG